MRKAVVVVVMLVSALSFSISNVVSVLEGNRNVIVLDTSNPMDPRIIQHYEASGTVSGLVTFGRMIIAIVDGMLEIFKLDADGRIASKSTINLGMNVSDLDIMGKIAVACYKKTLLIFDNTFRKIARTTLPWNVYSLKFFNERYLIVVLGRYGLAMVDLENPLDPHWIWRLETKEELVSIDTSERYVYGVGKNGLVFIVDLKDPEKPRVISYTRLYPIVRKLVYSSGNVYVLSGYRNLEVIDVKDPFTPKLVFKYETDVDINDMIVNGNLVYVSMEDGFYVLRFSGGKLKIADYSPAIVGKFFSKVSRVSTFGLKPGEIIWNYKTDAEIRSSPALFEGTLYFTNMSGTIFALTENGNFKWNFKAKFLVNSSPVIDRKGRIYFGSWDNYLYVLDGDGNVLWRFKTGGDITQPPITDGDRVYVGSEDGKIYAIREAEKIWELDLDGWLSTNIVLSIDGTLYFGTSSGKVYAVSYSGNVLWTFNTRGWISSAMAMDAMGNLYFGSVDNHVYALNRWGKLLWKYDVGADITAGPVLDSFGRVLVGTSSGELVALSRKGEFMWKFDADGAIRSTPAVSKEGFVYFGSEGGELYSLNLDGSLRWRVSTGDKVESSPLVTKNRIYFGSTDGKFYAVYDTTDGLDDGPWPMYCGEKSHIKIM